jgi:tetratricopeptide (TPR) repeat protein
VAAAVVAFGLLAGVLLARTAGERGVDDLLTGGIGDSPRQQVLRCQELGAGGGDLLGSLQCFDEVLAADPANAEALAYRGWYLILATGMLQESGATPLTAEEADELVASGIGYLDRATEADPSYPDPLAFRAAVYDRLGEGDAVCADLATLGSLQPPQFIVDLTADLASRNGC